MTLTALLEMLALNQLMLHRYAPLARVWVLPACPVIDRFERCTDLLTGRNIVYAVCGNDVIWIASAEAADAPWRAQLGSFIPLELYERTHRRRREITLSQVCDLVPKIVGLAIMLPVTAYLATP